MATNEVTTSAEYWDELADEYQATETISTADYHHGPLLPGDRSLGVLPSIRPGMRCLEVGSGAAQNSIYLASQGADCTATDVSAGQLQHGRDLAEGAGRSIHTVTCPMETLRSQVDGVFELVHSSGALCFSADPPQALGDMAACLAPGGTLVLSTLHPLAFAEWMEVEEDGFGVFLQDYFEPPVEDAGEDGPGIAARTWPISALLGWLREAGLRDIELWEPAAAATQEEMPYWSEIWLEHQERYRRVPLMAVLRARKPATS